MRCGSGQQDLTASDEPGTSEKILYDKREGTQCARDFEWMIVYWINPKTFVKGTSDTKRDICAVWVKAGYGRDQPRVLRKGNQRHKVGHLHGVGQVNELCMRQMSHQARKRDERRKARHMCGVEQGNGRNTQLTCMSGCVMDQQCSMKGMRATQEGHLSVWCKSGQVVRLISSDFS